MFVSPKVLYDSYISIIPVRVSRNDCGKAVTKIRVMRETLHSRDVKLGTVPYAPINVKPAEANENKRRLSGFHCFDSHFVCFSVFLIN